MNKGDKVRIKVNRERLAAYDDVDVDEIMAWDGCEFIFVGRTEYLVPNAELLPIDGFRPDMFNGNPESFYWPLDEVEPV